VPAAAWEAHLGRLTRWRKSRAAMALQVEAAQLQSKACQDVGVARRAVRTFEARARLVHFFEATVRTSRDEKLAKCPICFEDVALEQRTVLPCAHIGCVDCFEEVVRRDGRCPVCRETVSKGQVMRLEVPDGLGTAPPGECGRYGSKIGRLLEFLAELEEREPDAKIILFVQWEDLKRKVASSLEEFGVQHVVLQGGVWARQRVIERFQHSGTAGSGEGGSRVLLLSLQDSASGTNFTAANHVILFHPVIASTREASVACEMQAVGRALRVGQEKTVRIWRFVVAGTVEQRVTEEHKRELWERFRAGVGAAAGSSVAMPRAPGTAPNSGTAALARKPAKRGIR